MDEPEESPLPQSLLRDLRQSAKAGPDAASRARIEAAVRARTGGPTGGGGGGVARTLRSLALALAVAGVAAWLFFPRALTVPVTPSGAEPTSALRSEGAPITVENTEGPRPAPVAPTDEVATAPSAEVEGPRVAEERPASEAAENDSAEGPSEIELLDAAHGALAAHPARALTYLERHATLYPRGLFAEEREALAIEALIRAGRAERAASRRARFDAAYPSSPHRARLDELRSSTGSTGSTESTPAP